MASHNYYHFSSADSILSHLRKTFGEMRQAMNNIVRTVYCLMNATSIVFLSGQGDNHALPGSGDTKTDAGDLSRHGELSPDKNRFTSQPFMEAVRDMVFIHRFSPEGDHGPFLEVSHSACRILEYSQEELRALTPWDIIDREEPVAADERRARLAKESNLLHEKQLVTKSGRLVPVEINTHLFETNNQMFALSIARDISNQKRVEEELRTLRGILPICSFCKKIRNDKGYWEQVEVHIKKYSEADISHGICPECMKQYYPEEYESLVHKWIIKE